MKPLPVISVDTSFLISLCDNTRDNHLIAKKYFKYFIDNKFRLLLSTIVVSEFHQKQDIGQVLKLANFILIPYNFEDAKMTAVVARLLGHGERSNGRAESKDDFKIIAQSMNQRANFIITEDLKTLAKSLERLSKEKTNLEATPKAIVIKEGFSEHYFSNGQLSLDN